MRRTNQAARVQQELARGVVEPTPGMRARVVPGLKGVTPTKHEDGDGLRAHPQIERDQDTVRHGLGLD